MIRTDAENAGREMLFLAHRIPFPPDKGDKIRSFHMLRRYAERGWTIHLGALADDPADLAHAEALSEWCADVRVAPIRPRARRVASLLGALDGTCLSVRYFRDAGLQAWVDDIARTRRIEAVHCVCAPMAEYVFRSPLARPMRGEAKPRLALDFMDVDSEKWRDYARRASLPMRPVYALESRLLRRYERRVAGRFDAVLLVSEAEAAVFRRTVWNGENVLGVPNGVRLDYFRPAERPEAVVDGPDLGETGNDAPTSGRMVFCGAMDYFPNVDAVIWMAREVLPRIRREIPDAAFVVVGGSPTPEVRALSALPGVVVTGRVEDVRPHVRSAALSVAPLRIARGVQNKFLEARAMARPVLATPEAFEGIDAEPGRDLMVAAADPEAFAAAAVALLRAPERAEALGCAARNTVAARYDWDACLSRLDTLFPRPER